MSSTKKIKDTQYKKIIIKYNERNKSGYSFKTYNKYPFLKAYISKEKFRHILDQANIIIYDSKIKKAKFDKMYIHKCINILFVIVIFFMGIYVPILFYLNEFPEQLQNKYMNIGFSCSFISIIILFIIEGYNSLRKIEGSKTLYEFFRDDIINYIEKLNNEYKEAMIFKFDQINKNIICFIRLEQKDNDNNNNKKLGDTIPKTNDI